MSLLRPIIRWTAIAALRQRTWAEDRVFDSDNRPLGEAIVNKKNPDGSPMKKPYIVVFTDNDLRNEITSTEIYTVHRNLNLILEIGVASAIAGEANSIVVNFPATDSGMEIAVDITESQALAAVMGDPRSKWGELLRRMVPHVERIAAGRGANATEGKRWAARQVTLTLDTISDYPPGVPIPEGHPIRDFIALARSEPDAGDIVEAANLIENLVNDPEPGPSWEQAQSWMGLTKRGIRAIGLAPLVDTPAGASLTVQEGLGDVVDPLTKEGPTLETITTDQEGGVATDIVPNDPDNPTP